MVPVACLLLFLSAVSSSLSFEKDGEEFFYIPRFWTSTGFCPYGNIANKDITQSLLSKEMDLNLRLIGALPHEAITHIRIHWLLELIKFVEFATNGIPIYNFTNLDTFLMRLDEAGLAVGFEFMGNPGNVFTFSNRSRYDYLWEDLAFQVTKRYLNLLGKDKMLYWRFESWNEPDLKNYNLLNFTIGDYNSYLVSLRRGLNAAGLTPIEQIYFPLRGPAGLFKSSNNHPLCWSVLKMCNNNASTCPIDILTFHRKGVDGKKSDQVVTGELELLRNIYSSFPKLRSMPFANDEADPISGWSTPRSFQSDVQYAVILVSIILKHWRAKFRYNEFQAFESLSHDNAFISYHPYEFSQRTLLAHFRMNLSNPIHSQFIQKPVYAALGMLGNLGPYASKLIELHPLRLEPAFGLKTISLDEDFLTWLIVSQSGSSAQKSSFELNHTFSKNFIGFAFIAEVLEHGNSDPLSVWHNHDSPSYPNKQVREEMRRKQAPQILREGIVEKEFFHTNFTLHEPFILLFRFCSNKKGVPIAPHHLRITKVTKGEVLLTWKNEFGRCLKTYEVWYLPISSSLWKNISGGWHLPFPSFHFAPANGEVHGIYKSNSVDIFNRSSQYSEVVRY